MRAKLNRRTFLAGTAAAALPMPAIAQNKPIRIGLLTVKTGPLARAASKWSRGSTCS
jgi:branched-chain amino acid transport system substrate-binding protein